jgi:hypothetical protein
LHAQSSLAAGVVMVVFSEDYQKDIKGILRVDKNLEAIDYTPPNMPTRSWS